MSNKQICYFCGKEIEPGKAIKAHIIPKCLGGSNERNNLVTSCMTCDQFRARKELDEYLAMAIKSNTQYYETFIANMDNIKNMLSTNAFEDSIKQVFYRLLYSNIITSMETYLSDAFINTVMKDRSLFRRLVETDPEFKKRKLTVSEIYNFLTELEDVVKEHLLEIIYHNIWVVKNMYKCTINIDFPEEMEEINSAVMIRHDIVHRNGKDNKTGNFHILSEEIILKCIDNITNFIRHIDSQLNELGRG